MGIVIDMTGKRFGRLVILSVAGKNTMGRLLWKCLCDCGNEIIRNGSEIRCGNTSSCGCLRKEMGAAANRSHGLSKSSEWRAWGEMRKRCHNPKHRFYPYYGGRGISICERWSSFENFIADMGPKPPGHRISLDRIDNNGNYEPGNCRWATLSEQAKNKRQNKHAPDGRFFKGCGATR